MGSRKIYRKVTIAISAVIAIIPLGILSVAYAADDNSQNSCQHVKLPVGLAAGEAKNQIVSGTLCTPPNEDPHTIDVLTPGATYNSAYWDWPQDSALYSFVDKTLQAGRATFDYDRIGTGDSSRPLSTDITFTSDAYVLHQIISWLRYQQGYSTIDSIAHSYGSAIAVQEAGQYQDVHRLVVTGFLHDLTNPNFAQVGSSLYPADLDPEFAGQNLDPGYLTTLPNTRGNLFYDQATADPNVIAYDEAHKDTVSATNIATGLPLAELPAGLNISNQITAPALIIVGQEDALFCGAEPLTPDCTNDSSVRAFEAPYYTSAASLTAKTVPDTGHDLTLHPSSPASFNDINQWITAH